MKTIRIVSAKYVSDLAFKNELMKQTLVMTHISFLEYVKKNEAHDDVMNKFVKEDRAVIDAILKVKP